MSTERAKTQKSKIDSVDAGEQKENNKYDSLTSEKFSVLNSTATYNQSREDKYKFLSRHMEAFFREQKSKDKAKLMTVPETITLDNDIDYQDDLEIIEVVPRENKTIQNVANKSNVPQTKYNFKENKSLHTAVVKDKTSVFSQKDIRMSKQIEKLAVDKMKKTQLGSSSSRSFNDHCSAHSLGMIPTGRYRMTAPKSTKIGENVDYVDLSKPKSMQNMYSINSIMSDRYGSSRNASSTITAPPLSVHPQKQIISKKPLSDHSRSNTVAAMLERHKISEGPINMSKTNSIDFKKYSEDARRASTGLSKSNEIKIFPDRSSAIPNDLEPINLSPNKKNYSQEAIATVIGVSQANHNSLQFKQNNREFPVRVQENPTVIKKRKHADNNITTKKNVGSAISIVPEKKMHFDPACIEQQSLQIKSSNIEKKRSVLASSHGGEEKRPFHNIASGKGIPQHIYADNGTFKSTIDIDVETLLRSYNVTTDRSLGIEIKKVQPTEKKPVVENIDVEKVKTHFKNTDIEIKKVPTKNNVIEKKKVNQVEKLIGKEKIQFNSSDIEIRKVPVPSSSLTDNRNFDMASIFLSNNAKLKDTDPQPTYFNAKVNAKMKATQLKSGKVKSMIINEQGSKAKKAPPCRPLDIATITMSNNAKGKDKSVVSKHISEERKRPDVQRTNAITVEKYKKTKELKNAADTSLELNYSQEMIAAVIGLPKDNIPKEIAYPNSISTFRKELNNSQANEFLSSLKVPPKVKQKKIKKPTNDSSKPTSKLPENDKLKDNSKISNISKFTKPLLAEQPKPTEKETVKKVKPVKESSSGQTAVKKRSKNIKDKTSAKVEKAANKSKSNEKVEKNEIILVKPKPLGEPASNNFHRFILAALLSLGDKDNESENSEKKYISTSESEDEKKDSDDEQLGFHIRSRGLCTENTVNNNNTKDLIKNLK